LPPAHLVDGVLLIGEGLFRFLAEEHDVANVFKVVRGVVLLYNECIAEILVATFRCGVFLESNGIDKSSI
jgi:hypothetical protein